MGVKISCLSLFSFKCHQCNIQMENFRVYQSPETKIRLGKNFDGGYVIADTDCNYDIFLSGGISDDISFEEAIMKHFFIPKCEAYDGTVNKLPWHNPDILHIKQNLGNGSNNTNNWVQ